MRAEEPYSQGKSNGFAAPLEEEAQAEVGRARVYGLVDERWCPPEVAEIRKVDVGGIRTGRIDLGRGSVFKVRIAEVTVGESIG